MGKKNNLLVFLILLLPFAINHAGNITNYTITNGLPTFKFFSIAQDTNGVIFASSDIGIITYNGTEWRKYKKIDGVFRKVIFDSKGRLWAVPMSANENLYVVDGEKVDTVSLKSLGTDHTITDAKIFNNSVYICVNGSIVKFDEKFGISKLFHIDNKRFHSFNLVNGNLVVLTADSIYYFKNKKLKKVTNRNNLLAIKEINFEGIKRIFAFAHDGLCEIKNNEIYYIVKKKIPDFDTNFYNEILYDGKSKIYFGNILDLFIYDIFTKQIIVVDKKSGFKFNGASDILKDYEGNIWISGFRGINKVLASLFYLYDENSLLENEITTISFSKNNTFLGHNRGFSLLKKYRVMKKSFLSKDVGSLNRILDSEFYNNSFYFISQGNNLYSINPDGKNFHLVTSSSYTYSTLSKVDKSLFYVSGGKVKSIFNKGNNSKQFVIDAYIRDIFELNDTLYFSTTKGLFYNADGKLLKDTLNIYNTYKYLKKNGIPYIATNKGLFKQVGDSLINIFEKIGLPNTNAYTMVFESDSILWVGTNKGVLRLNVDNNNYFLYDENWGLPSNEVNRNAFLIDSEKKLWVGTADGLGILNLKDFKNNFIKPKLSFDSCFVNASKYINLKRKVNLAYSENNLVINFNNTSFYNENLNSYEVKLFYNGKEKYIFNLKEPELRLFNLNYGDYKIIARMKNARGIWSDPIVSSSITIDKPFYFQLWFLTFNGIFGLILIYFVYNYLSKIKYSKLLEDTVNERTKALRESEQKYRILVETSPEVIFLLDENFRIIFSNMRAVDQFGLDSLKEIEQKYITDYIKKSDIHRFKETYYFLLKDGILRNAEFEFLTKYKGRFSAIVNAAVISPDETNKLQVIFTIKDITRLKQTEKSLQKLNDELEERIQEKVFEAREFLNQSPFAICIFDKKGFINDVNETFLNITNLDIESEKFRKYNIFEDKNVIESEYFPRIKKVFNYGGIVMTQPIKAIDYTDIFDFDIEWIRARFYSIKDALNEVTKVALLIEDVTEQKTLEEITHRLRQQKVQANKIIEAIEKERARIARDIHDGIGQMLSGVKLKLEGFEFKYNLNDNELSEAEDILESAATELRRIVYNIHPLVLDNYGLKGALENLIDKINPDDKLAIDYEFSFEENHLDSNQKLLIYRIIQEALANAIKHSHSDRILLNLFSVNNTLTCTIKDEGVGFIYEDVNKKGFGFINMIQRADLLNAEINIDSNLGEGTEVKIILRF